MPTSVTAFVKSASEFAKRLRSTIFKDIGTICIFLILALVIVAFSQNLTVQEFLMGLIKLTMMFILSVFAIVLFLGIVWRSDLLKLLFSEEYNYGIAQLERLGDHRSFTEDDHTLPRENNPRESSPKTEPSPELQLPPSIGQQDNE